MNFLLQGLRFRRKHKQEQTNKYLIFAPFALREKLFNRISEMTRIVIVVEMSRVVMKDFTDNQIKCTYIQDEQELTLLENYLKNDNAAAMQSVDVLEQSCIGYLFELGSNDSKEESMFTNSLMHLVPKKYPLIGAYLSFKGVYYPVYSDRKVNKPLIQWKKPIAVVTDWDGYGDAVMIHQQIQAFIDDKLKEGIEVHIITYEKLVPLYKKLLKNCKVYQAIQPGLYSPEHILKSGIYSHVHRTSARNPSELQHCIELCANALGYKKVTSFRKTDPNQIDKLPEEINELLVKTKQTSDFMIGFQYSTQDPQRSWSKEHAERFVSMCCEAGIAVFNLAPVSEPLKGAIDVSSLSITELFPFISKLDIVVGIDSVCGHIAGVVGTPSITIWGKNFPHITDPSNEQGGKLFSFRVLSNNYSFISEDANAENIPPSIVFNRMLEIQSKRLKLKEDRITGKDTLNELGIEWVRCEND
ncbi:glycosyltransferase family 9 protein [Cytobacillus pseudoceanisediminis]|uniref:glycosyltransferase family 9 protein n=1 Tax=Cytobacillus pseudoceanisediminis TaxID=3051614 RepID=UPI003C2FA7AC